jgi:hypothetical protein
MAPERAGGNELAQLVADHILRHVHGHVLAAVMDGESVTDEFREDRGGAAPGLDDLFLPEAFIASTRFIRAGCT